MNREKQDMQSREMKIHFINKNIDKLTMEDRQKAYRKIQKTHKFPADKIKIKAGGAEIDVMTLLENGVLINDLYDFVKSKTDTHPQKQQQKKKNVLD
jgi:hypothetical protein